MTTPNALNSLLLRDAEEADLSAIRAIYDAGIEDRLATLDEDPKPDADMREWFGGHTGRYPVVVASRAEDVVGWASLNPYSLRCAYPGVADLSVYVDRAARGSGVGTALLGEITARARRTGFHKIVHFALTENATALGLYRKMGFRDVGVFKEQGRVGGRFIDVIALEKLLKPLILFVCKHNTGRSQMAEAFLRSFAGDDVEVTSAGTTAADRPDPGVVAAMAEVGIDISGAKPKLLDPALVDRADRIVTMGCDVEGVSRIDEDWGLPDPKGERPERVREIRDLVRAKSSDLAKELLRSIA